MSAEGRRLTLALLLSLLIHTLLLSLTFGGQGLWLPSFGFHWRERWIEAPDLRVVLVPAQVTAAKPAGTSVKESLQQASIEQTVAGGPALRPSVSSSPTLGRTAEAIVPKAKAMAQAEPEPNIAIGAVPAKAPLRTEGSGDAAPTQIPEPAVIAMERSDEATLVMPAAPLAPTTVIAVAPSASSPETVMPAPPDAGKVAQKRAEPEVRERAVEVAKLDPSEREAQRQADQLEAQRHEAARQEEARVEAARLEAERQEAARQAAAQLEAQRHEAARQEATRVEAARLAAAQLEAQRHEAARQESARVEAARLEAERQEAMRQAAARQEAARVLAEQEEEEARREARLRAIGRQLDEEAARRGAASTAARSRSTLPLSLSTTRRVRLWGRTDPNVELVQYAEAWARKIQFNTSVDTVREVAKRPHTNPMVTVAIRSDGSVESVTFVLSSGVAEVDEAIRRIVESHVPYQAFPPGLARKFDVIEVRRTWHFDMSIQLD